MDVFLRELARSDLGLINSWRSDASLIAKLGASFRFVGSDSDEKWFDTYLSQRGTNVRLAVCSASAGVVGVCYVLGIDWINRSAEFAIMIGNQAAQGKGIGEAATRLTLRHAFADLNLERVYLEVLDTNDRARRLYEKVGFQVEGLKRHAVFKSGVYQDMLLMSILRTEFLARSETVAD